MRLHHPAFLIPWTGRVIAVETEGHRKGLLRCQTNPECRGRWREVVWWKPEHLR